MESLKDKTAKGLLWGGLNSGMQQVVGLGGFVFKRFHIVFIKTPSERILLQFVDLYYHKLCQRLLGKRLLSNTLQVLSRERVDMVA